MVFIRRPFFTCVATRACALWLLVCVAACTSVGMPPLPNEAPAAWRQSSGPDEKAATAPAPDLQSWWKAFGDPQLDSLVERALTQNLNLAQARSRWRQARLLTGRDNAQYLPALSAGVRTLQDVAAVDSYFHASLDATWELGLFGAREGTGLATQGRLDEQASNHQAARVSVVAEVVRNYLDLRIAQQQEASLQRLAALDSRAMQLQAVRNRTHTGNFEEHSQAVIRLAQTQAQLSQPRQMAVHAAQALAVLLGQAAPDAAWTAPVATIAPPTLASFALTQVPADLLRFRPDIRTAEAQVRQAAGELGIAQSELYPHVTIGASYVYAYNLTQNRRNVVSNIPGIGPTIDIPLFDWGRRRAAADARQEALNAAVLGYRQAVIEGLGQAESAMASLEQAFQRQQQVQIALDAARKREEAQQTLAALGLVSELDRLGSERVTLQAAMELATAQAGRSLAFVALYKALGGAPLPPLDEPDPHAGDSR